MKNHSEVELKHTFIKSLSVKVLDPIELLSKKHNNDLTISPLGIKSRKLGDKEFEVLAECKISCENQDEEEILYIKLEYSGIFNIVSVEESVKKLIYVDSTNLLYPFVRAEIISLTAKLGMPPIYLPFINFEEQFKKIKRNR